MNEDIINNLKTASEDLQNIHEKVLQDNDYRGAFQRFLRWIEGTAEYIKINISHSEFKKFNNSKSRVGSYTDRLRNFELQCEPYEAYIKILIETIETNPNFISDEKAKFINNPSSSNLQNIEFLENLFEKFSAITYQLNSRNQNRLTLEIKDEYDVQYLLHSLLKLQFNDIRDENPLPKVAGASSRTDFHLYDEKIVLETKMTRRGLTDKEIGKELIIDIAQYSDQKNIDYIIFFIYDPAHLIRNKGQIITDIERKTTSTTGIKVYIKS